MNDGDAAVFVQIGVDVTEGIATTAHQAAPDVTQRKSEP